MNKKIRYLITVSLFLIVSAFGLSWSDISPRVEPKALGINGESVLVIKVIDGDTFEIEDGQKVRMVGIDTPETVDPRRPVGCFGKEASNETKSLLTNKRVILQKDVTDKDKYGRLLRLIYLPLEDESVLFVNDYLVREGYAKAYRYPPDTTNDERFKLAEKEAKEKNKGRWGKCDTIKYSK